MSARRLRVLVQQLPIESATNRAMNGGRTPWGNTEHLLADLWAVMSLATRTLIFISGRRGKHEVVDHPTRIEMNARTQTNAKKARVIQLRALHEKRRRRYGLE